MVTFLPKWKICFVLICLVCCGISPDVFSQAFSNITTTPITDNGTTSIPIVVTGLSNIDTVNFGLQSVTLNITHSANQQLGLQLQSPDGTVVLLASALQGANLTNTEFDDTSALYIDFGVAPYQSTFRAIQDISLLNNFQNPNGTWQLIITDSAAGNTGQISGVSLQFGNQPAKPLLSASNLPIIKIDTHGQEIPDDPKIVADMYIIYDGAGQTNYSNQTNYNYAGKIGIEIRGHSSQQFPKKQYSVETRETNGIDDSDVVLLGLPKQSDWILSANYSDKSLMRNVLTYKIANEMGQYASRTIYCEVIINNEYRGVFVLEEKIKRDKNRVNVEKIATTDITPPNVTGGYIFSIDKLDGEGELTWMSKVPGTNITYQFVYPKAEDIQPEQSTYMQDYVDSFEEALNGPNYTDPDQGFRKYADQNSFMQYFIINELARNIDAYRISSYFHKSRSAKIVAGPVWDYDIAWGNANYYDGNHTDDYAYSYAIPPTDYQVPFWWSKLRTDALWEQNMVCMYNNARQSTLSSIHLNYLIDSFANELQAAQQRNFTRWHIIGQYVWPNPSPIPASYSGEVSYLKSWIADRLSFMDADLGGCLVLPITLNNFKVTPENNRNKLSWTANTSSNSKYFIIERAGPDQSFSPIGKVEVNNASPSNNYSFYDTKPLSVTTYYRLKSIDADERFAYSNIISLNVANAQWHLYPNKVHNQLNIISPLNGNENIYTNIYNMQGQKVASFSMRNNTVIRQNISHLSSGNYVLEIVSSNGNKAHLYFIKD
jgi:subtilisin-like proprotein convertase family protein